MKEATRYLLIGLAVIATCTASFAQKQDLKKDKVEGPAYGSFKYDSTHKILDDNPLIVAPDESKQKPAKKRKGLASNMKAKSHAKERNMANKPLLFPGMGKTQNAKTR